MTGRTRVLLAATVITAGVAGLAIAAMSSASHPAPQRHEVAIRALAFEPARLEVRPGDTVVFTNLDIVPHTATSRAESWDSGALKPGDSWSHVVGARGSGDYLCTFHPMMTGSLDATGTVDSRTSDEPSLP